MSRFLRISTLLAGALLASCAAPPKSAQFETPAGAYAAAFEGAKDELRRAGFELDRVDARAGVITTRPSASAGFWTPWVVDEQSFDDEVDGTFNAERRIVTVRFTGAAGDEDLREHQGPVAGAVEVEVFRLYRPGRTIESSAIRLTSQYRDEGLTRRGLQPDITVPIGQDEALAAALASRIFARADAIPD